MSELRNAIIQKQIEQYYPNARIVSDTDADSGLKFYTEQQLHQLSEDWFPLSCRKDTKTGTLVFGGRGDVDHTYTIGETGAGKTTRLVIQSIRALSAMPDKPSFLITDMHGEIVENLFTHLKENGYTVKILNCDNPLRSDTYNPLAAMANVCGRTGEIDDEAHDMIRKIAEVIQPIQSSHDPIWDMGARSYTHGCILDKFEDLLEGKIPAKCITLYNLIENHYWLRQKLGEQFGEGRLRNIPHYAQKPRSSMSVQKIISVTDNADKTRRSYWGVVENHYDVFGQPSLYRLSSSNTIDVEEFLEKPTAIIVQSGASTCGDQLASFLVNDIYTTIVRKGREQQIKRLKRPIHCFLDEFANCHIAEGSKFIEMLTTSRKFGMHWHMMLQCDAQMESKYDKFIAATIRANCTEIFLGSFDYDTASRFAQSCGKTTIESLMTRTTQQAPVLEVIDLITPDRLNLMEPGVAYVRSKRHPLLKTYYEAFYNCEEYANPADMEDIYPHNRVDYRLTAFFPDSAPRVDEKEFAILNHLQKSGSSSETELTAIMPIMDVKQCLRSLKNANMIKEDNGRFQLNISRNQFDLLKEQYEQGRLPEKAAVRSSREDPFDCEEPWTPPGFRDGNDVTERFAEDPNACPEKWTMEKLMNMPIQDLGDLRRAGEFTCIPEELAENMMRIANGVDPKYIDCIVNNMRILKFEIIEAYITNNNFSRKDQWIKKLRNEVQRIKQHNWFNEETVQCFDNALKDMDEELTLGNIREIKKIISDAT